MQVGYIFMSGLISHTKILRIVVFILLQISLCSCNPSSPTTSSPTLSPIPTRIPRSPTSTVTLTPIPTQTQTNTPSQTNTPTPSPMMDFSKSRIINIGILSDWRCLVTFQFPEEVQGEYFAVIDKNKQYTCEILLIYPNRLYCTGPLAALDDDVDFQLFQQGLDYPVFKAILRMPKLP